MNEQSNKAPRANKLKTDFVSRLINRKCNNHISTQEHCKHSKPNAFQSHFKSAAQESSAVKSYVMSKVMLQSPVHPHQRLILTTQQISIKPCLHPTAPEAKQTAKKPSKTNKKLANKLFTFTNEQIKQTINKPTYMIYTDKKQAQRVSLHNSFPF